MESWIKESLKEPLTSVGLLIMRVTVGLTMALLHGWPKLAHFSERAETFADPLGLGSTVSLVLAMGAEFFCSLLLVAGLFSRAAAVPLLFTMFVIVFLVQAGNDLAGTSRELALVFGFCYLTLIFTGPGRFSVDHLLMKRKQTDE